MDRVKTNAFSKQTMNETTIIKRILAGEKELFEILVRRNNQRLYRVIRSYIKDESEIEDVMQDSFIKAYTKLHQFKLAASFSTWLIRIGINESLAKLKKKDKTYHLSEQLDGFKDSPFLKVSDCKQLNPQDRMIQHEAKQLLESVIDDLALKYRTIYILKEVEEMSLKEIADALSLTVGNVKVRLHRAKMMLKEKLYERSVDKNIFDFGFSRCDRVTESVMSRLQPYDNDLLSTKKTP